MLGVHVNRTAYLDVLCRWKPNVVVVLDHNDGWYRLKEASPRTLIVGRVFVPDLDFNHGQVSATEMFERLKPTMSRYRYVDYWQGVNEPVIASEEAMANYAAFEIERMKLSSDIGCKCCIGNFAVGNPTNIAWWQAFTPALSFGASQGAILGLHEYWWDQVDNPWLGLRHRFVYNGGAHGWQGLWGKVRLPLVITECGRDYGVVEPGTLRGWQGQVTDEQYLAELLRYGELIRGDPYVLGAAVFCLASESWLWTGYDIAPILERLAQRCTPLYRWPEKTARPDIIRLELPKSDRYRYERRTKPPTFVVLHHSGAKHGHDPVLSIRAINRYHISKGWPGIGYHLVIAKDGRIFQVNDLDVISYHAAGVNATSIGVCLLGDFSKEEPGEQQVEAAVTLLRWLHMPVKPHNAINKTACPGRAFKVISWRL